MAKKQKFRKVKLTDKEFSDAVLQRDINSMNLATAKFNIEQARKAIELGLPLRQAKIQLKNQETEFEKLQMNKKYYDKLVRNKYREEPVIDIPQTTGDNKRN